MSNFSFPGFPSSSLSQTSSSSSKLGSPFGFGQASNSSNNNSFVAPFGCVGCNPFSGNSTGACRTTPSVVSTSSPFHDQSFYKAPFESQFTFGFGQTGNASDTAPAAQVTSPCNSLFSRNLTGVFRSNSSPASLPHFSGPVHQSASQSSFGFSAIATQAAPFSSLECGQSNVNSPFPSVHSDPFSAQTQSSQVTGFSPFSSHSNSNSPFPVVQSNQFSAQTQSSGVMAFSPFPSQPNANSPFPSVHSNPFSAQTQSSGVTALSPFSSQPNANSPFSSVHSNPFSFQTQSSGVTGFAPFSSQSNANSYLSNHSNLFSPQTQSFNSVVARGFSTSNVSSPFFNSIQSQRIPISPPVILPSSGSGVSPYASTKEEEGNFLSISCMPFYKSKSHEELRFDDYQLRKKDVQRAITQAEIGAVLYAPTKEPEGNFHSISSMPFYKSKSHEELRFNDYQLHKKDGQRAITQAEIGTQANSFYPSPFPPVKPTCTDLFHPTVSPPINSQSTPTGFAPPVNTQSLTSAKWSFFPSPFTFRPTTSPSVSTSVTAGLLTPSTSATTQENIFAPKCSSSAFDLSNSPNIAPINSQSTPTGFFPPVNTQSMPSNLTSAKQLFFPSPFPLCSTTSPSVSTSATAGLFAPSTLATTQENIFAPKCSSSAFDLSNSPNIAPSLSSFVSNFGSSQVTTPGSTLCLSCNCIKTQSSQPTLIGPSPNFSPNQLNPLSIEQTVQGLGKDAESTPQFQSSVGLQPFPDAVQISSGHPGSVISVQYGISSLSVSDKAAPTRTRSLLIVRHSSLNRTKMLPPRYNPDSNASRVPFFMASGGKATEGAAKTNSVIFPRENPRSWIRPPTNERPRSYNSNTLPEMEHTSINVYENGNIMVELSAPASTSSLHPSISIQDGNITQVHLAKEKQTVTEAVNYKHDIDVDAIMPMLKYDDYYTEPTIQELTAKEKEEPGFCSHVKDFVIGRQGFGAIKFIGETDVRGLDLDTLIRFNNREVSVYMDDSKKPEVGKGLNKPAEVTLLNLKCIDKKTGKEYKDGPVVDKYKNLLIRKSAEQGAEFVSYDPAEGEWKFKVHHF